MTVMVYRYRVPVRIRDGTHPSGKPALTPVPVPAQVTEQLRLAHRMRNELVAAHKRHEQAKQEVWSSLPAVAAVEAQITQVEAELGDLGRQTGQEHSDDRSVATRPGTAARLRELREQDRTLRQQRRDLQSELYSQVADQFAALMPQRAAKRADPAVVDIRRRYAAAGLYWGSYNAVIADHCVAVESEAAARTEGRCSELRFKRWDGTGTLTVQLQREHGGLCRCVGCAQREVDGWRIADTPQGLHVWHRSQDPAVRLPVDDLDAARQHIAAAVGLPEAALIVGRRKPRRKTDPGQPYITVESDQLPAGGPGPSDPQRTPQLLAGASKWRNVFGLWPWMPPAEHAQRSWSQRRLQGTVRWGMGRGRAVELPVTLHRMIPAEADICEAQLTVTRTGSQTRMQITVTVQTPDPEPVPDGRPSVAVHCGWRRRGDGSVRVACWVSSSPLPVPERLRDVVVSDADGRSGEIVVPTSWLDVAGRPASLRGIRDTNLAPVADKLATWLDDHPQPDPTDDDPERELTGARVRTWRATGRFAALTRRWAVVAPQGDGAEEILDMLRVWARQDLHLWDWEAHERQQIMLRRDDRWRSVARWLAEYAGRVVVDDTNLAVLRRRSDVADDDPVMTGERQQQARARAALAAPGELRACIQGAADRDGVAVAVVDAAFLTRTCPRCGHVGDADARYAASAVVACPSCGGRYDQDRSAATLMLVRERSSGGRAVR